jgi:hypothetical protein
MSEVKDVFQRLLKDPPPMSRSAGEVLSAARGSRTRRRSLLASGAAAFAVVAIAGSAVLLQGSGGGTQVAIPSRQGSASASPQTTTGAVSPPALPPILLRFVPGWVPAGWAEYGRMGWSEGEAGMMASRIWAADPDVSRGEVKGDRFELSYRKASTGTSGGTPVDINGLPGTLLWEEGKSLVDWQADRDTLVTVIQWGNRISQADLLRIARSVRPDPGLLNSPVRVGPVPEGFAPSSLEISGRSPATWHASLAVSTTVAPDPAQTDPAIKEKGGSPTRTITVAVGTETLAPPGGQPTTVAGRPARYVADRAAGGRLALPFLVVDLGDGLWLTVSSFDLGYEQLMQVAEGVTVDPAPHLAWIGPH